MALQKDCSDVFETDDDTIQPPNSVEPQGQRVRNGFSSLYVPKLNFSWLSGVPLASVGTASALNQAGPNPRLCVHWSDPMGL